MTTLKPPHDPTTVLVALIVLGEGLRLIGQYSSLPTIEILTFEIIAFVTVYTIAMNHYASITE